MLLYVFLILLALHYAFIVLAIEKRRGGYILMAAIILIFIMWSAAMVIQIPVTYYNNTSNDVEVVVRGIQDPITAFFLFTQTLVDFGIYVSIFGIFGNRGRRWF